MKQARKFLSFASLAVVLGIFLVTHAGRAQETPPAGEPAKVEAPAAAPAAPAEAKKEDPGAAPAQFTQGLMDQIGGAKVAMDTMWTLIAGMLVFFMNLGFATVESGLCRAKNAVTILAKNFIVFTASSLAFLILGWGLMFGDGNPFFGTQGLWFVGGADNSPAMGDAYKGVYSALNWTGVPLWTKFFFQLVFAGTAATIVSGAVAERIKFGAFYIFTFIMVGLIYPITGHWIWGGGWAAKLGMFDFAGSTVVHSVGGWAALAGIIVWDRVSVSTARMAGYCQFPAIAWRWQLSAFLFCGSDGSGLTPAARWRPTPARSVALPSRPIQPALRRQSLRRSRHGCF